MTQGLDVLAARRQAVGELAKMRLSANIAIISLVFVLALFGPVLGLNPGSALSQAFAQSAVERQVKLASAPDNVADNAGQNNDTKAGLRQGTGSQTQTTADAVTAIAYDGRLLGDQQTARLLIDLDRKVEVEPFYMNNPARVVIDLSKTAFRFHQPNNFKPRGLVADLRYGTMARGSSRIVISLNAPVKIILAQLEEMQTGRYRFTLDLQKIGVREFDKLIAAQGSRINKTGNMPTKGETTKGERLWRSDKQKGRLTIVLDPGHGGIDGGAKGRNGAVEKDITLEVALNLERAMKAAGPYDVYLTRREDYFVSLKERVMFSTRKQADLFISIHADTLRQKKVRGSAVYTLSKKASDEFSKQLAEAENRADLMAGLPDVTMGEEIVDILADMAARQTKKFSVRFARQVVEEFRDNLDLIKNPHRNAAFEVLKDPNVPSVLLEIGYLSNREDEKRLQSKQWRAKFSHHLSHAVGQFFADNPQ